MATDPVLGGLPDLSALTLAPGGGATSTDPFASMKVDLSGLFAGGPRVTDGRTALTTFELAARGSATGYTGSGTGSSTGQFVAIQDAMLKGGFYGSARPTYGVLTSDDINAFQSFLKFADTNYSAAVAGGLIADGQAAPNDLTAVGLLNQQAAAGVAYGISAAARRRAASLSVIRHVNPEDSAAALESQYKQLLGRDPTQAEKDAFHTAYDAQVVGPQEAIANAQQRQDATDSAAAGFGSTPGMPGSGHVSAQVGAPGPWATGYVEQNPDVTITSPQGTSDIAAPGGQLDAFMSAISGQESGGNYNSVNKDSGAQGRFQIMPSNWPSWSQQAGLGPNAAKTPQNQDKVARFKFAQYFNSYHNWGAVAAAWYGGPSAGAAYLKDPNQAWLQRRQGGGKYPSIAGYVASVTNRLNASGASVQGSPLTYNLDTGPTPTDSSLGVGTGIDAAPGSDLHVVDAATLNDAAEAAAKAKNPTEYGAHQVANTFSNFLQLLGGVT
jgi:hypothetical protein